MVAVLSRRILQETQTVPPIVVVPVSCGTAEAPLYSVIQGCSKRYNVGESDTVSPPMDAVANAGTMEEEDMVPPMDAVDMKSLYRTTRYSATHDSRDQVTTRVPDSVSSLAV